MFYNKGVYQFAIFLPHRTKITHAVSNRHGGVSMGRFSSLNLGIGLHDTPSAVEKNYQKFLEPLGIDYQQITHAHQKHTDNIVLVEEPFGYNNPIEETDAFITNIKKTPILVRFADCQGVLIFDPENSAVAAIHAGWQGNAKNIIGRTVQKMQMEFGSNPKNLLVGISPSLGPCCAEFSNPHEELPPEMHQFIQGNKVDLWECSRQQLLSEGVIDSHIEIAEVCTVCNKDEFFSYRGENQNTGRMGGVIELL